MDGALGLSFTWFGHSCVRLVSAAGTTILFDPWFGNPRSPATAESVERCDVLLVTHGHFDHLGAGVGELERADAIRIARRTHPAWPAIHELSLWLGAVDGLGAEVVGMNKGGSVEVRGVRVSMVHADHSAGDWLPGGGVPIYLGEPAGFVVQLDDDRRVYFAGDTALFGDMRLIGELHRPEVAFLPIGGHFTMDPVAAAWAAELLGVSTVVPIHYGTFPILAGTPDELRRALAERGRADIRVLSPNPGETLG